MAAIYLDTTKNMTIGLLRDDFSWISYQAFTQTRSTESLHFQLQEMLNQSGLKISDITNLFTAAGPGSYTGMRVSEGIAQIFNWQKIKTNSFYHFQVPQILGVENYVFMCKAFKGEFFLKDSQGEALLSLADLSKKVAEYREQGTKFFTHYPDNDFLNFSLTSDLISAKPLEIFSKVDKENMLCGPFYFRTLEKEFKVTNG